MNNRIILDNELLHLTLERLCRQLIEDYGDFSDTAIIGVQPRGVLLSDRIVEKLRIILKTPILYGRLDTTFYRDDFRSSGKQLKARETDIEFTIEGKKIILIDDVLFTGRTIRAALDALLDYGRASEVKLMALVNRRFNRELPIQPDFIGLTVDTQAGEVVSVDWGKDKNASCVIILKEKP
ncbi:MAG: bifunctional pyr operon transcriptional regulator/uracil phosphoribosyltransferase PyrR [Chitinophagales bacterium]|nr:bifunctional pyr operon transcriptional regulator/uracil phosphoribosyltransferase PyrR [Chitinophagales bacterium]